MNCRRKLPKILLLSSLFLLFVGYLSAEDFGVSAYPPDTDVPGLFFTLPDTSEAREFFRDTMFSPIGDLMEKRDRVFYQKTTDSYVKFDIKRENGSVYLLFLRKSRYNDSYSISGIGNYIIKRNLADGRFLQAKVFLRDSSDSFVRLFPDESRTRMDLILKGYKLYEDVIIPLSFRKLLVKSFSVVEAFSSRVVDWNLVFYRGLRDEDSLVEGIASKMARYLPQLRDADDGAMDSRGRFVFIKDGSPQDGKGGFNCSGFAKWVVDGFYYPLTGKLLSIERLKKKNSSYRGNRWSKRYEKERDPYFGLDWSRNLASALFSARNGIQVENPEKVDVRDSRYIQYVEDIGYPIHDLEFLLFYLTYKYPGYFYIGSVNREFGENPTLRQHFHVVVLFPYFDKRGRFRVRVMERARETGIGSLIKRYPGDYIHLVKLRAEGEFKAPGCN